MQPQGRAPQPRRQKTRRPPLPRSGLCLRTPRHHALAMTLCERASCVNISSLTSWRSTNQRHRQLVLGSVVPNTHVQTIPWNTAWSRTHRSGSIVSGAPQRCRSLCARTLSTLSRILRHSRHKPWWLMTCVVCPASAMVACLPTSGYEWGGKHPSDNVVWFLRKALLSRWYRRTRAI